jgi:hypothetical protein
MFGSCPAALQPASITSDEWKIAFFGSLTNSQAGDNVDADGDGALNWQEYVAGTNPTNALSCLQFTSASLHRRRARRGHQLADRARQDLHPAIQPALTGALDSHQHQQRRWQRVSIHRHTNYGGGASFYQIEIQP